MITKAAEFTGHWRALLFRDYLRAHSDVARDYGALKVRLAEEHRHDRIAYTRGTSDFIAELMAKLNPA
jgi:GrpB-like predicted nucleotidyltransferase (UPF0157 family)